MAAERMPEMGTDNKRPRTRSLRTRAAWNPAGVRASVRPVTLFTEVSRAWLSVRYP
jgi:hypothetical protein